MEGDGPPSVCAPSHHCEPCWRATSATISQPGVRCAGRLSPAGSPETALSANFPRNPTPIGHGCFSVDPGATAAPGPATLSVRVGNLSSFPTKVEYYESVAVAFARRPFIAEAMGALLLMPARDVMEATRASSTSGVTVSLDLPLQSHHALLSGQHG